MHLARRLHRPPPTACENILVITGHSCMGLTHGTHGAMIVRDPILGRDNPWAKLYDPSRKEVNLEFVKDLTNTASQYKDFVTRGDVTDEKQIPANSGAILREGLKKLAVYRDDMANSTSARASARTCIAS